MFEGGRVDEPENPDWIRVLREENRRMGVRQGQSSCESTGERDQRRGVRARESISNYDVR